MIVIGLFIILIDQLIKYIISTNITYGESIGKYIKITNIGNTGMAYSLGNNNQIIITIVSSIIIGVLVYFLIKNYKNINKLEKISLILIISGGASNLIDRLVRGYVLDYIDINNLFSYPVFNIADICVVIGGIILIGYLIIKNMKEQEKHKSDRI